MNVIQQAINDAERFIKEAKEVVSLDAPYNSKNNGSMKAASILLSRSLSKIRTTDVMSWFDEV